MGAWELVGDIAGPLAAGALLMVLVWGAIDRGRVHRALAQDRELRKAVAALLAPEAGGRGPAPRRPRTYRTFPKET